MVTNTLDAHPSPLSIDLCRQYLEREVFQLRPQHYNTKYPLWPGSVGLEVEMLPVKWQQGHAPALIPLQGGKGSLAHALCELAQSQAWQLDEESIEMPAKEKHLQLLRVRLEEGDTLTFEPGGQLEFSSKPYPCLSEAMHRLQEILAKLDDCFAKQGWQLQHFGANPWHTVDEIGLQMPKSRYRAMDAYFASIGPFGRRMMRQTCTVQVCLDFGASEAEMAKRFLASQLLAPFAAAIFAYSPYIDGQWTRRLSYRTQIWRGVDDSRTGFPELETLYLQLDKQACVEAYLAFALQAGVVFIEKADYLVPQTELSFESWIQQGFHGIKPNLTDFITHLSLLFPEVRPRGFLELRSVDAQARPWQGVPAAFYTGLLYDEDNLNKVIDLLHPQLRSLNSLLEAAADGLKHETLREHAKTLMQWAWEGFKHLPPCFRGEGMEKALRVYGEHFTNRGRTPADDWLEDWQQSKYASGNRTDLCRFHDKWLQLLG